MKRYAQAFLKLCFPQLESGFRGPSVAEAIQADEKAWEAINELYAHHDWELGDAVAEIIDVRMILHVFLQPRLAAPTSLPYGVPQPHGGGGKRPLGGNRLKGKGKSFMGKSFGKGKQSAAGRSDVVKISGQVLTICRHVCNVPRADGAACGGKHAAMAHRANPH